MAKKVAGDQKLDFEGMKQAVRNAIDIYEKEIAGEQAQTNVGAIVDEALARARSLVDVDMTKRLTHIVRSPASFSTPPRALGPRGLRSRLAHPSRRRGSPCSGRGADDSRPSPAARPLACPD